MLKTASAVFTAPLENFAKTDHFQTEREYHEITRLYCPFKAIITDIVHQIEGERVIFYSELDIVNDSASLSKMEGDKMDTL